MRVTVKSIAAALIVLLPAASIATAQPQTVMPGDSIQAAIDAAAPGAVILVEAGRYNEAIDLRGKAITLRSLRGRHVTLLDGEGLDNAVLRCVSGETPDTVIDGFTITNGSGSPDYAPSRGGGLLVRCSSPTFRDCLFEGNAAAEFGGGAYIIGETLALQACAAAPLFEGCEFRHNLAARGAGLSSYFASPRLERCAFLGNVAGSEGGGLRVNGGTLTVVTGEFVGNTADRGGAVFLINTTPAPASASIVGSTITANVARIARGGVQADVPLTITNSILYADTGPEVFSFDPLTTTVAHCLVDGGFPGTGNMAGNPLFRRAPLCGLDEAWGTVDDEFGDLRLSSASPCIDRANGTLAAAAGSVTDADDCPRVVDDAATPNAGTGTPTTVDIGAHERRTPLIVDPAGGGDHATIQAAINAAEPCDEVIVRAGTYNEAVTFDGKAITVRSASGPEQTILSGAGLSTSIVRFISGEDRRSRLEGVTITGSRGLCEGGGVRMIGSSPTLLGCRITNNILACPFTDNWGAGVFIQGGAPAIIDCDIDGNVVGNGGDGATFGAGVYAEEAALHVSGCTFHDNISDNFFGEFSLGGGICHFGPLLRIENSTFSENLVDSNGLDPGNGGAGVYSEADRLDVIDCTFVDNYAGENVFALGGGIWQAAGVARIERCTFTGNHVGSGGGGEGSGGALAISEGEVVQSTFINNEAVNSPYSFGGAAVAGDATFRQCLFEGNRVTAEDTAAGGALFAAGDVHVVNTIFRDNTSSQDGGAVAAEGGSLTVSGATFLRNSSLDYTGGGAIAATSAALHVSASAFADNTGAIEGGAVRLVGGEGTIDQGVFLRNEAPIGGAVLARGASLVITASTFTENIGCGAALWTDSAAAIQGSDFERNFPDHIQGPYTDVGGNFGLPYADMDGGGTIDVHDLLAYLDIWFGRGGTVEQLLAFLGCWFSGDAGACPGRPGACS